MSTKINVIVGDQRLLQDNKTRAAANQQALDSRTQQQQLEQEAVDVLEKTSSEERPSDVPQFPLVRRPAAQRRKKQGNEEEEEEKDEDGNLIIRYIGLYRPIRSDNVRAQTVTWPTLYETQDGNILTRSVYDGGTNFYTIEDTVFRPTFDFWRGGTIVANSVSAPPLYALNNAVRLSWVFRRVGSYFPNGVAFGPTYVSAPVGTFPFNFNQLQNLERAVFTLASSTVEHVYYSYAYIEYRAPTSILNEIDAILSASIETAFFNNNRIFTAFSSIFNPINTHCGYVKLNKRTSTIEFKQFTFTGADLGSFVDNLYVEDPHYVVALSSSYSKNQYPLSRTIKWPSSVQYNPKTGIVVIIATASSPTAALREVYTKEFGTNLTYAALFSYLVIYAPYSSQNLQAGGFTAIGTVNGYDSFGELYSELFPLISL
jgi:hypothetical protein